MDSSDLEQLVMAKDSRKNGQTKSDNIKPEHGIGMWKFVLSGLRS